MNRERARRRRGTRAKQARAVQPLDPQRHNWRELELCYGNATTTLSYWLEQEPRPACFVYFICENEKDTPIKIGSAARPGTRCAELQCGNARELFIAQIIVGTKITELDLHRRWRTAHIRGEWFGSGYQDEILAFAERTAQHQIDAHKRGDMHAFRAATDWRKHRTT